MAKRIQPEEMIEFHDDEAKALADETRYGLGTPIEARIANAIIENAANIKAQNKGMNRLYQKLSEEGKLLVDSAAYVSHAAQSFQGFCDSAERIADDLEDGLSTFEEMPRRIAREVLDSVDAIVRTSVRESVRKTVEETNCEAVNRMNEASGKIEELIERSQKELGDVSSKVEETLHSAKLAAFHPIVHFALAFALAVSIATSMATYTVLQPVVSGEAQIVYAG